MASPPAGFDELALDVVRGRLVVALALALATQACVPPAMIPGTTVEDTKENRDTLKFCEKYRNTIERRDVAGILRMTSETYFDDGDPTRGEEPIDYVGLKAFLAGEFERWENLAFGTTYGRIDESANGHVYVSYQYDITFRLSAGEGSELRHGTGAARLDLIPRDHGEFLVKAGSPLRASLGLMFP